MVLLKGQGTDSPPAMPLSDGIHVTSFRAAFLVPSPRKSSSPCYLVEADAVSRKLFFFFFPPKHLVCASGEPAAAKLAASRAVFGLHQRGLPNNCRQDSVLSGQRAV